MPSFFSQERVIKYVANNTERVTACEACPISIYFHTLLHFSTRVFSCRGRKERPWGRSFPCKSEVGAKRLLTLHASPPHPLKNVQILHKTRNQLRVAIECHKGVKVKVVKWCWKKWNGPILMHIYAKQCEIMQKNQWKGSNGQIHCFCKGKSAPRC